MAEIRRRIRQRGIRFLSSLLLGLAVCAALSLLQPWLGGPGSVAAAERSLELQEFRMVAQVVPDGSVRVRETLTARFQGSWNGLRRRIPLLVRRDDGVLPLGLQLLSVSDEQGQRARLEAETIGEERELRIYVPNASDAIRSATLSYRVRNALRFDADRDVFYWNVTGNGWEIPIDHVSAEVLLPEGVKGVTAEVYTGPLGATERDARVQITDGRTVTAESTRRLAPGEGLTLMVGFNKGLVPEPTPLERRLQWWQGRLVLLLPLTIGLSLGGMWWWLGRDPSLGSVPVAYEPPDQVSPAVLGSLVQQAVPSEAIGSTLVHLAVKGHLRIEPLPRPVLRLSLSRPYRFWLLNGREAWSELEPHEIHLLDHLFDDARAGATVNSDDLRDHFYVHVPAFERLVREAVLSRGYYRRWPGTMRALSACIGVVLLFGLPIAVLSQLPPDLAVLQTAAAPLLVAVCLGLSLVLIAVFSWLMPSRTLRGVAALRQALGFRMFLRRVDAPRFNRQPLTEELFERFLPYAMVSGLTRQWTAAFSGIVQDSPSWYASSDGGDFDLGDLGSSLEDCCSTTSSVMQTSPSSSGSGGGGGGFSGGGAGGGGGGGF